MECGPVLGGAKSIFRWVQQVQSPVVEGPVEDVWEPGFRWVPWENYQAVVSVGLKFGHDERNEPLRGEDVDLGPLVPIPG